MIGGRGKQESDNIVLFSQLIMKYQKVPSLLKQLFCSYRPSLSFSQNYLFNQLQGTSLSAFKNLSFIPIYITNLFIMKPNSNHSKNQVHRIFPTGIPQAIGPYSPVTLVPSSASLVFISGQIPINPQSNQIDQSEIEGQTHQVMKNLQNALKGAGCSFNSIAKATILLTDIGNFGKVNEIYGSYFQKDKYPARIAYAVKDLPKGSLVQIEAIAIRQGQEQTESAPQKKRKTE